MRAFDSLDRTRTMVLSKSNSVPPKTLPNIPPLAVGEPFSSPGVLHDVDCVDCELARAHAAAAHPLLLTLALGSSAAVGLVADKDELEDEAVLLSTTSALTLPVERSCFDRPPQLKYSPSSWKW